ncbi:MAG: PH domain-containing protein [Candidatus Bathyarchaeia archaeon]
MAEGLKRLIPKEISLRPDETVTMVLTRRFPSILTSLVTSFLAILAFSIGNVVNVLYRGPFDQLQISSELQTMVIVGAIIVGTVILAIVLLIGYFYVKGHLYVVTNKRILVLRKFIGITVREVAHQEVTDIVVNQGPIARLLDYGSVTPMSPGVRTPFALPYPFMRRGFAGPRVSLKDVSDPCKVASNLNGLIRSITKT